MWWRTPWLQQRWLLLSLAFFDALLLLCFYNLLFWHRFDRWAGITGSISTLTTLWVALSYLLGRYSRPDQGECDSQRRRLASTLLVGVLVLSVTVVVLIWGLRANDPRSFRSFVLPVLGGSTLISGAAQLWIVHIQRRARHWLLIGSPAELSIIKAELEQRPQDSRSNITYCPTSDSMSGVTGIEEKEYEGIAISETSSLEDSLLEHLLALRSRGDAVITLTSWCEQQLQRVPPELFSNRWLLQAEGFELQPGNWQWRIKRLGDLFTAAILLVLSSPVIAIACLLILLEDGRPIFYSQIRTGLYGQPFLIRKLRSMRTGSEQSGAQWAKRNDRRITNTGTWLRRLRIDELPQLANVITGEMSLIGPRPERPELEANLEQAIPHYRVRHWIRPGLSGWAQVCFPYGASQADSRMKLSYDIFYMRNAGIFLDLLILIKTIRLIVRRQGYQPSPRANK
jgi:exopolysaccharide biosynthesis polyprenyl glycosylphosphotransferase